MGPSWSWSYDSWVYNYLCNQCLSPLKLCSWRGVLYTTLCDEVCQWLSAGLWFFIGSSNKTDRHDITEILLKVALNTITLNSYKILIFCVHNPRWPQQHDKANSQSDVLYTFQLGVLIFNVKIIMTVQRSDWSSNMKCLINFDLTFKKNSLEKAVLWICRKL